MAASTSETAFLTIVKSMTYRGAREEWSNAYHFDQVPPDSAIWDGLATDIWYLEHSFLPADVQYERALGHLPGTPPVLVFDNDAAPPGEGGPPGIYVPAASEHQASGDVAAWIRYATTQKNTRGKPIYLRNYYHAMFAEGAADALSPIQKAQMDVLGNAMVTGFVKGGVTYRRAGPRGAVAQSHAVGQYLTTRTLKHRGKRRNVQTVPAGFFPWKSPSSPPILIE